MRWSNSAQHPSIFLVGKVVGELFAGRAHVHVLRRHVAEVLLDEPALDPVARGLRLGQRHCDARLLTRQDLLAAEVAAVGHDLQAICRQGRLGQLGHGSELGYVRTDIGHVMSNDQMVLGVDGGLHVVAHDAGASAAGRHRAASGSVSDICWSGGEHPRLECFEALHLLPELRDFRPQPGGLVASASEAPAGRRCRAAAGNARRSPQSGTPPRHLGARGCGRGCSPL